MIRQVDLHTHSIASDGQYAPTELVKRAKECGIEVLAVTDHDTMDGLDEAVDAGREAGVCVIRGIELGAREYKDLHILGYGFNPAADSLCTLCRKMKESRDERKHRIIAFLKEKGIALSLDEVEQVAGGEIIARPHFAQVLLKHGYVASIKEAFDRYLDTDEYDKIKRFKVSAQTCIERIRQAGGVAVFAHPYQVSLSDGALDALVRQLKEYGLDGLECYYPQHTPEQVRFYLELARKYGLHVTAGSDFHGERVKPDIALQPVALDIGWLLDRISE